MASEWMTAAGGRNPVRPHWMIRWAAAMALTGMVAIGSAQADEPIKPPTGWRIVQSESALVLESSDARGVTVQVGEPVAGDGDLETWMKRLEGRSLGYFGAFTDCRFTGKQSPSPMGALACRRAESEREPVGLILGVERLDGQYQYLVSSGRPANIETVLERLTGLLVHAALGELDGLREAGAVVPPPPVDPLRPDDIEGVYMVQIHGLNGFTFIPHLLLKNGQVLRDLVQPPTTLARNPDERRRSGDWGLWTRSGDRYHFTWPDGESDEWIVGSQIYRMRPAGSDDRIEGAFQSISSSGNTALGGDFLAGSWETLYLEADGRFILNTGRGGGDHSASVLRRDASRQGLYRLNGYTAELAYDDGRTELLAFYFFDPRKDPPTFGLGNRVFSPVK